MRMQGINAQLAHGGIFGNLAGLFKGDSGDGCKPGSIDEPSAYLLMDLHPVATFRAVAPEDPEIPTGKQIVRDPKRNHEQSHKYRLRASRAIAATVARHEELRLGFAACTLDAKNGTAVAIFGLTETDQ